MGEGFQEITNTLTLLYTGDIGLRGPVGEAGVPGAKGDQGIKN